MCHSCNSARRWSRRRFLLAGSAAVLLTACGANEAVPTLGPTAISLAPTLTPTPPPTPTLRSASEELLEAAAVALGLPHVAGVVTMLTANAITIAAPVGQRQFALSTAPLLVVGDLIALWLDEAEMVTAVQKLPPFAATEEIPEGWSQAEATGEKRPWGDLELITRAGWGAGAANWATSSEAGDFDPTANPGGHLIYSEPLSHWLNTLVVHHSALEYLEGPREIQRLHILQNRFADVGYHFFIDGLGQLYEGRPLNERGAHTGGYNTGTVGVCLLGNFEVVQPVTAQLITLHEVAVQLRQTVGITHLTGHRGFQPDVTLCPGEKLWPLLPTVAEEADLVWGTGGYVKPAWQN